MTPTAAIDETGGTHGIRDLGQLASAVARPQQTFAEKDLYPTVYDKAAALFHSLIYNHPFLDGNKRTAITATGVFLEKNNRILSATNQVLEHFTLAAVIDHYDMKIIATWLQDQT